MIKNFIKAKSILAGALLCSGIMIAGSASAFAAELNTAPSVVSAEDVKGGIAIITSDADNLNESQLTKLTLRTEDGKLQYSADEGKTWVDITNQANDLLRDKEVEVSSIDEVKDDMDFSTISADEVKNGIALSVVSADEAKSDVSISTVKESNLNESQLTKILLRTIDGQSQYSTDNGITWVNV